MNKKKWYIKLLEDLYVMLLIILCSILGNLMAMFIMIKTGVFR